MLDANITDFRTQSIHIEKLLTSLLLFGLFLFGGVKIFYFWLSRAHRSQPLPIQHSFERVTK